MTLALAIPCHNDQAGLRRLLSQAADFGIFKQVVIVDDGSDEPVEIEDATYPFSVKLIRHTEALGPGVARNRALTEVTCSHVLFFDSDDLLGSDLVALWNDLQGTEFDFCLFRHNDSRNGTSGGQAVDDEVLWEKAGCVSSTPQTVPETSRAILAQTASYPWNKIYNCAFLSDHNLRCTEIFMHEDVELHWLSFLHASKVLASTRIGATHYVFEDGARLTNRRSIDRFLAFAPMRDIHNQLADALGYDHDLTLGYLRFIDRLWNWIESVTDTRHLQLFRAHKRLFLNDQIQGAQLEHLLVSAPHLAQSLKAHVQVETAAVQTRMRVKVHISGEHKKRTPLSYPALASLFEGRVSVVEDPYAADVFVFAHNMDLKDMDQRIVMAWRDYQVPILLMSEEPFWDTIWGKKPLDPVVITKTRYGAVPVHQVSHQTSDLFHFEKIPYYLLTNPRFENAYSKMFARNAKVSANEWRDRFAERKVDLSFMFERRPEPYHSVSWDDADLIGLCSWRTELAEACDFEGVEKLGQSWDGSPSRLTLEKDWHQDKLDMLDDRSRMIGAIENTHQPHYVTEKFFDAFACGAMPIYYASASHRIHDFGLPEESWINLYGLSPQAAAEKLRRFTWQPDCFEAFSEAQSRLANLFGNPEHWRAERRRLSKEVPEILENATITRDKVKR